MKIITGTAHPKIANEIASALGIDLIDALVEVFPDGETSVKINDNIRGEDVFLIQSTCNPANHHFMELLILVDAVRRASAHRITAVLPFFGYARQDRKDQSRVPITAKLIANLLVASGVNRVLTIDLHAPQIQGFFDIPVDHLYAAPLLVRYFKENIQFDESAVVVSPDVGAVKMARAYADALNADLAIVAKHRTSATEVEATNLIGEVEGKIAWIVDDMTESAGTLCAAADIVKKSGAKKIYAGITHSLFSDLARERIAQSEIEEIITTNTTPFALGDKVKVLSVAPLLASAIERICEGKSVSDLFRI